MRPLSSSLIDGWPVPCTCSSPSQGLLLLFSLAALGSGLLAQVPSPSPLPAPHPAPKQAPSPEPLRQLVLRSERILRVRIHTERARFGPRKRLIWTDWQAEVLSSYRGPGDRQIRITEPGGIIGTLGQRVAERPRYRVGEELIVFLSKDALGAWRTEGAHGGRWRILPSKEGRERLRFDPAHRDLVRAEWPRSPGQGPRRGTWLNSFEAAIRTRLPAGSPR